MHLHEELLLRILIGTILAGVIGYERYVHHRPAGFRTHLIVGMASSTFMTISTHFVYFQHYGSADLVAVDTSRIAAAVVTGIGFLAGGAILRTGVTVQGLTTAAGLWLATAIGMAAGSGMYPESVAATVLGILILAVVRRFESDRDRPLVSRQIQLTLGPGAASVAVQQQGLQDLGVTVIHSELDEHLDKEKVVTIFRVSLPESLEPVLHDFLRQQSGVRRIRIRNSE